MTQGERYRELNGGIISLKNVHAQLINCFGILMGDYLPQTLISKFGLSEKSSFLFCT
jgi:hypothetical protein